MKLLTMTIALRVSHRGVSFSVPMLFDRPHLHIAPPYLKKAVGKVIQPVFDRLSEESLFRRCLKGSTQNRNESLHATIWDRCPKSQSGTPKIVETAVCLAVINFNEGAEPLANISQIMGLERGRYAMKGLRNRDYKHLYHARLKHSVVGEKRRSS